MDTPPTTTSHATSHETGRELTLVASDAPDRVAVYTHDMEMTFADLEADADALAGTLAAHGVRPGDVVALLCTNRSEWLVTYEASLRAGVILLPVNWHLEAHDVSYVIADSGARAAVVESAFASTVANAGLGLIIAVGDEFAGSMSWTDAIGRGGTQRQVAPVVPRGTQMIYTSGTSGRPKGVRHEPTPSGTAAAIGESMIAMFGMDGERGDTILCPAPLYHSGPSRLCCEWPLSAGVGVVLMDRFDPRHALELIERHRITHAFFVPTMFQRLLALPDHEKYDVSSLRFVLHGAGPCTVATKQAMFDWLGPVIHEIYAASEGPGTWITPQEWLDHPGSVGRIDSSRLQIRDSTGTPVGAEVDGAIWFLSTSGFSYHQDPDKTATTYDSSGKWYTVGDRGRLDMDGYLYLTGRTSECIISGGVNIYPARIDDALVDAPGVLDGAAFGLPDPDLGEIVAVAVVPLDPTVPHADIERAVIDHCQLTIGRQLSPRIVFVVDDLPRSDAGKLYRRRLIERFTT